MDVTKTRPNIEGLNVREDHLTYLKKMLDAVKDKSENQYLLLAERLIFLTLDFLISNEKEKIPFDALDDTKNYLDIMNRKSVDAFNENKMDEAGKCMGRIIELLNHKSLPVLYEDLNQLYEVKILSYNNLSCIYRKLNKLSSSVKVVSFAIGLEEKLVEQNYGTASMSIISTFLNKSAILSEMKQHSQSIEAVNKAIEYLRKADEKPNLQESEKVHLKQLDMLACFNLGVENEQLKKIGESLDCYSKAKTIAQQIGKDDIAQKIEKSIRNLKRTHQIQ